MENRPLVLHSHWKRSWPSPSRLEDAGVDEIEAGTPAIGEKEIEEIAAISSALSKSEPIAWCRMTRADVDAARKTGLKRVNLSVPVSDIQMQAKLNLNRAGVLNRIRDVIAYAVDCGLRVAMGGEDSSRADMDFLLIAVETAESTGAHRFRFADTLGNMEPFSVYDAFTRIAARQASSWSSMATTTLVWPRRIR